MYNTVKTNITVQKIDTNLSEKKLSEKTLSQKKLSEKILSQKNLSEKTLSQKKLSEKTLSQKKLSEKTLSEKNLSQKNNTTNLNTLERFNKNIDEIQTCIEETDLVINKNSSENIEEFNTEELLNKDKLISDNPEFYTLYFKKNNSNTNNYFKFAQYLKKNRNTITDLLYKHNIIKNKNIPFRLLFHIYVNFLNNDIEIIFC